MCEYVNTIIRWFQYISLKLIKSLDRVKELTFIDLLILALKWHSHQKTTVFTYYFLVMKILLKINSLKSLSHSYNIALNSEGRIFVKTRKVLLKADRLEYPTSYATSLTVMSVSFNISIARITRSILTY